MPFYKRWMKSRFLIPFFLPDGRTIIWSQSWLSSAQLRQSYHVIYTLYSIYHIRTLTWSISELHCMKSETKSLILSLWEKNRRNGWIIVGTVIAGWNCVCYEMCDNNGKILFKDYLSKDCMNRFISVQYMLPLIYIQIPS